MNTTRAGLRLAIAYACIAACVATLTSIGEWRNAPGACLVLFATAGVSWWVAVRAGEMTAPPFSVVCAGALLLRAIALLSSLGLSDDVHRYVFEGELVNRGISPYAFAPSAPELAGVRAEIPLQAARVAHAEVPAIYPPLVHATAAFAVRLARALQLDEETGAVNVIRVVFGLADLLVLWPLAHLLRRAGRPPGALVAWAFCPFLVFEFAGSGHLDSLGVLLFLLALLALTRADEVRRTAGDLVAGALLAAAIATKYLPMVVLPWLGTRSRVVKRALFTLACTVLAFAPFSWMIGGERGFGGGLGQYGERWEAGSLVFRFVRGAAERVFEPSAGWSDPGRVARLVVGVAWLVWAIFVAVHVRDRVRGAGLLVAGFLVLTPTLHPWYLAWMLPFVALHPSRAWLWMFAAAPVLYAPLADFQNGRGWSEPAWMWPVLALPFFALLALPRARPPVAVEHA